MDIAEFAVKLISEITNVPSRRQTIRAPIRKAASEAPIMAKLFVAAKFELLPPVVISKYSEAVTISQNIRRKSK